MRNIMFVKYRLEATVSSERNPTMGTFNNSPRNFSFQKKKKNSLQELVSKANSGKIKLCILNVVSLIKKCSL